MCNPLILTSGTDVARTKSCPNWFNWNCTYKPGIIQFILMWTQQTAPLAQKGVRESWSWRSGRSSSLWGDAHALEVGTIHFWKFSLVLLLSNFHTRLSNWTNPKILCTYTSCVSYRKILYSIRSHHNYVDNDDDTFCNVVYKHLLFLGCCFVNFNGVRDCCNI